MHIMIQTVIFVTHLTNKHINISINLYGLLGRGHREADLGDQGGARLDVGLPIEGAIV